MSASAMDARIRSGTRTGPGSAGPGPEAVQEAFRRFRESAVRLVERVNDLQTPGSEGSTDRDDQLHIVRSVFGKWSIEILTVLHRSPAFGFEDLRRGLPGISPRVLSLKLKELEENGMVERTIMATRPPRVEYALTERGWTVSWLAEPILLYLRHAPAEAKPGRASGPPSPPSRRGSPPPPR